MLSKNKYRLPFRDKATTVAISDPRAHPSSERLENSVDFLLEREEPILAVAGGIVWSVKDDSTQGGPEEKFADIKYQNFITIKHKNGEYSQYVHLAKDSSLVEKGDKVKEGQPIAKGIGLVGYTTALHLHFMVFDEDENSLEINWEGKTPKVFNGVTDKEELLKEIEKNKQRDR